MNQLRIECAEMEGQLKPVSLQVTERIGRPFSMACTVAVRDHDVGADDFMLQPIHAFYDHETEPRHFHGLCCRAQRLEEDGTWVRFVLDARPQIWRLSYRKNSKIFQKMTPVEIVLEVLAEGGVTSIENRLDSNFPLLDFAVQYNESDFQFISRVMEEHGFYYFFQTGEEQDTLVLCDKIGSHESVPLHEAIAYLQPGSRRPGRSGNIFGWTNAATRTSSRVEATDYDFTRAGLDLAVREDLSNVPAQEGEIFEYPGLYLDLSEGSRLERLRSEELAAPARHYAAQTNIHSLSAGHVFSLTEAGDADGDYLVIASTHGFVSGDLGEDTGRVRHSCTIEAIQDSVPFRMPRVTRRPIIAGVQTATVVGPRSEEIFTDKHGRVKVQFRWDREGQMDEHSSCWIRVATPWAGMGWGQTAVPRIGQEVVVQFEEGNPDRPIITGMLFNSNNTPNVGLPQAASQMGMRSNTTPGGGGANEILMEDQADAQFLRLTAERDYMLTAKNDATVSVGFETAAPGSLTHRVFQDHSEEVEAGNFSQVVKAGNRSVDVQAGSSTTNIASGRTDTVVGTDGLTVEGDRVVTASATYNVTAPDVYTTGTTTANINAPDVIITGDATVSIGTATINVTGSDITIEGSGSITLTSGGSTIVIDPGGVQITAPVIKNNA